MLPHIENLRKIRPLWFAPVRGPKWNESKEGGGREEEKRAPAEGGQLPPLSSSLLLLLLPVVYQNGRGGAARAALCTACRPARTRHRTARRGEEKRDAHTNGGATEQTTCRHHIVARGVLDRRRGGRRGGQRGGEGGGEEKKRAPAPGVFDWPLATNSVPPLVVPGRHIHGTPSWPGTSTARFGQISACSLEGGSLGVALVRGRLLSIAHASV